MASKIVALLFVVLLVAGGWWAIQNVTGDDSFQIKVAFGIPVEGAIEMHAIASMGMTALEAPGVSDKGRIRWDEWAGEHFFIQDESGSAVPLGMRFDSDVIKPAQVNGTPEGFLVAKLRQGAVYQFDYKPNRAEPKRYRYSFTAPAVETKAKRYAFVPA